MHLVEDALLPLKVDASEFSSRLVTQQLKFQTDNTAWIVKIFNFGADTCIELFSPPVNCIIHNAPMEFSRL